MENKPKTVTDDDIVEYVLQVLMRSLDKNELHLEKDILQPAKLELKDSEIEHVREMLMATQLVRNSVGFGKNGFVYLTPQGIQVIKTYGSYRSWQQSMHGLGDRPGNDVAAASTTNPVGVNPSNPT